MKPLVILRALRALLRVELREIRLNPRRSLLLIALVGLPVAAVAAAATLTEIARPTGDERRIRTLGAADLRLDVVAADDDLRLHPWQALERARERLGSDVETAVIFEGIESVSTLGTGRPGTGPGLPATTIQARLLAAEPATLAEHGVAEGMVGLRHGRYPHNAGEVALSAAVLDLLGLGLGDRVVLEYGRERTIVGQVFDPEQLDATLVVRRPAAMELRGRYALLARSEGSHFEERGRWAALLPELEPTWAAQEWPEDPMLTMFVFGVALLGCFEAALVIAAAIAIGLRRRQVQIGLLGAAGADAVRIGGGLIGGHVVLGVVASSAGVLVGWILAWVIRPWTEAWANRIVGPFEIDPGVSVLAFLLGVGVVTVAVAAPAVWAAQLPVKTALAGRRPKTDSAHWMAWLGGLTFVLAIVLLAVSMGGNSPTAALAGLAASGLGVLGMGLLSPALLSAIGQRATKLPLAPRLAVRDTARFRQRNGAVVTAVIAGMAMSVTVAGLTRGLELAVDALPPSLRADQVLIHGPGAEQAATEIAASETHVVVAPLHAAYLRGEPLRVQPDTAVDRFRRPWVAVGDDKLLEALGMDAEAAGTAPRDVLLALDAGGSRLGKDGEPIRLATWIDGTHQLAPEVTVIRTGTALREPAFVLPASLAERLGVENGPPPSRTAAPWLVRTLDSTDPHTVRRLEERLSAIAGVQVDTERSATEPLGSSYFTVFLLSLVGGFTLVWIATALSAAESRADEDTLHTVGAEPSMPRHLRASRSTLLAGLGCTLSVIPGLMAAQALINLASLPIPFVVPWLEIALTLTVLPTIVYVATRWTPAPGGGLRNHGRSQRITGNRPEVAAS